MSVGAEAGPSGKRRRERRVPVHLPLLIRGTDRGGEPFEEETSSENLCRSGAAFATRYHWALVAAPPTLSHSMIQSFSFTFTVAPAAGVSITAPPP